MLLILPTLLVLLATAVHIPAEETRAFGTYNTDRREPESVGEDLSYVEKLLVAERVNTQDTRPPQQDEDEGAFVSGQSDPQPEILHAGIEPTSVGAVDHESSEDRLQRTRQTAQPKLNRAHPESPCPSVFSYEGTRAGKERWYGVVLVTTDAPLTGVRLIIQLNKKAQILGNWLGEVCTKDNIEFRIWNSRKKIQPGPPVSVKFFVKYSDKEVDPPRIRSISLNGKQICKSSGRPVTRPPVSRPITPSTTTTRRTTPRPNTITTTSRPHTSQHGQNGIATECKQRWLNLLDQFLKAHQKQMMASGQAFITSRQWMFEKNMSFLVYIKDKDKLSYVGAEEEEVDNQPEEEEQEDQAPASSPLESSLTPTSTPRPSPTHTPTPPAKNCTHACNPPNTASATVMMYLIQNREQNNDKGSEKDPLDLFFQSMLKTVKSFSPIDQHIFRNQMFKLVSDMEAKYLIPHPPISNMSHQSSSSSPSAYHGNETQAPPTDNAFLIATSSSPSAYHGNETQAPPTHSAFLIGTSGLLNINSSTSMLSDSSTETTLESSST